MTPEHLDSHCFKFKTVTWNSSRRDMRAIFAQRYQVYCLERGFLQASSYPDGLEIDEYDVHSIFITASNQTSDVVGSLRLVQMHEGMCFPFRKHCTDLFDSESLPPIRDCVEISRVVISKVLRRRNDDTPLGVSSMLLQAPADEPVGLRSHGHEKRRKLYPLILLGMMQQAIICCKEIGVSHCYVSIDAALAQLLQRLNFDVEAIGASADYFGPVTPYILAIDKLRSDHITTTRTC